MLFFLISCFSFILLSKSLSLPRANEMRLLSLWFCKELPCFLVLWLKKRKLSGSLSDIPAMMSFKKRPLSSKVENVEEIEEMSILDLPELTLECILGMLPPSSLCNMAGISLFESGKFWFPGSGWWYGVVGHLELCDRNENYCQCHSSDTVVLEFNQYTPGSRWRQTIIDRKDHEKKEMKQMGFMEELENFTTSKSLLCGSVSGQRKPWSSFI
ncbi:hypothetical protein IFM89_011120 [Coptis chinensis]|uniref:F-box protein n=1 Tax=Coptis chinensis TaxID=261450 RepID=A0A835HKF5_9MAGN|nr:hypothetical protein IFM89_011120 [Coptis chinensis]